MLTTNLTNIRFYLLLLALLALCACSGGGGASSSSSDTPVTPPAATTVAATATWFVPEGSTLSATQVADLFDTNQLYVNVPSSSNSSGEIRGEITPSPVVLRTDDGDPSAPNPAGTPLTYSALLGGDQVRPRNVVTRAHGYGSVKLDPATKRLTGYIVTSGISGTAAYLRDGLPGSTGAAVVTLEGGPVVWRVPENTFISVSNAARLSVGACYFTVSSSAFPEGEIRGQLDQQLRVASLKGSSEVPPVDTSASGVGYLALNPSTLKFSGFVKVSGLGSSVRSAVLHVGLQGTNGPGLIVLTDSGNGIWSVPPNTVLSSSQVANFNNDELYFNIHTQDNLAGEVRGQLSRATVKIGSTLLNGSKEIPEVSTAATGSGLLAWNSVTGQLSGNVTTDKVNGTSVMIHSGSATATGPAILALNTNSPVTATPTPGVSFLLDVQPVFNARCISLFCHATGGLSPMSLEPGRSYTSIKPLIVPGRSLDSFLYQRLTTSSVGLPQMPLNRTPLSAADLGLIKNWIDNGALDN